MQRRWIYAAMRNNIKTLKKFSPNQSFSTLNLASTSQPKRDIKDFLKAIVQEYSNKGQTFLLPWSDTDAIEQIQQPFQELLKTGSIKEKY